MKISKGVEWAAHACTLLAVLPKGWTLSADDLATYHEVPPAYMAKQMQALSRAGLILSIRGAIGGYRLAKPADEISLWDIMAAIEGSLPAFHCTEIRQNGRCGARPENCQKPCGIAAIFFKAEQAFRQALSEVNVTGMMMDAAAHATSEQAMRIQHWIEERAAKPGLNG